jgi:hypothetical protein
MATDRYAKRSGRTFSKSMSNLKGDFLKQKGDLIIKKNIRGSGGTEVGKVNLVGFGSVELRG